jgi:hypothetical protein
MEGVNSSIIDFKHFYKCHNVPLYNDNMIIKYNKNFKSPKNLETISL